MCVYTRDYRDHTNVAQVLAGLRALGFGDRLTYKEDAATEAMHYRSRGQGPASLYLAGPGETSYRRVRPPFTAADSKFGAPKPVTPEQLFDTFRDDYGLL